MLLLCTAWGLAVYAAQTVSQAEALDRAMQFLNRRQHKAAARPDTRLTLAHKAQRQEATLYYVFNRSEGGFIIVGGDRVARPILGYSNEDSFSPEQLPPALQWWLEGYEQEIFQAIRLVDQGFGMTTEEPPLPPAEGREAIGPLLTASWSQALPYNHFLPGNADAPDTDHAYLTGCVATAMVQVMKRWQYPTQGLGRQRHVCNGFVYEADYANTTYAWEQMTDRYRSTYEGTEAEDAVATAMYHAGVSVWMKYGQNMAGGSSAYLDDTAYAMCTHFGYSTHVRHLTRSSFTDQQWEDLVYADLLAGRPVIYGGQSPKPYSGGHCFVLDGYQPEDDTYHVNWGWNGSKNGYFVLTSTNIDPLASHGVDENGVAVKYTFKNGQEALFGLEPATEPTGGPSVIETLDLSHGGYATLAGRLITRFALSNTHSEEVAHPLSLMILTKDCKTVLQSIDLPEMTLAPAHEEPMTMVFSGLDATKLKEGSEYCIRVKDNLSGRFITGRQYIKVCTPAELYKLAPLSASDIVTYIDLQQRGEAPDLTDDGQSHEADLQLLIRRLLLIDE